MSRSDGCLSWIVRCAPVPFRFVVVVVCVRGICICCCSNGSDVEETSWTCGMANRRCRIWPNQRNAFRFTIGWWLQKIVFFFWKFKWNFFFLKNFCINFFFSKNLFSETVLLTEIFFDFFYSMWKILFWNVKKYNTNSIQFFAAVFSLLFLHAKNAQKYLNSNFFICLKNVGDNCLAVRMFSDTWMNATTKAFVWILEKIFFNLLYVFCISVHSSGGTDPRTHMEGQHLRRCGFLPLHEFPIFTRMRYVMTMAKQ